MTLKELFETQFTLKPLYEGNLSLQTPKEYNGVLYQVSVYQMDEGYCFKEVNPTELGKKIVYLEKQRKLFNEFVQSLNEFTCLHIKHNKDKPGYVYYVNLNLDYCFKVEYGSYEGAMVMIPTELDLITYWDTVSERPT